MRSLDRYLEIYKCAALTVIVFLLAGIFLRTAVPFTLENVRSKKVEMQQIPLVRVQGGTIDVDNIVQVEGRVQIDRY